MSRYQEEMALLLLIPITLSELEQARKELITTLHKKITEKEKRFLISMKEGSPEWEHLGFKDIDKLPGLQWKLINIKKMSASKRKDELMKLKAALGIDAEIPTNKHRLKV